MHFGSKALIIKVGKKGNRGDQQKDYCCKQVNDWVETVRNKIVDENHQNADYDVWDVYYLVGSSPWENHPEEFMRLFGLQGLTGHVFDYKKDCTFELKLLFL